jgi:hypothetical protein
MIYEKLGICLSRSGGLSPISDEKGVCCHV